MERLFGGLSVVDLDGVVIINPAGEQVWPMTVYLVTTAFTQRGPVVIDLSQAEADLNTLQMLNELRKYERQRIIFCCQDENRRRRLIDLGFAPEAVCESREQAKERLKGCSVE